MHSLPFAYISSEFQACELSISLLMNYLILMLCNVFFYSHELIYDFIPCHPSLLYRDCEPKIWWCYSTDPGV